MKQKSVKNKNVIVHNDRGDSVRLNKYISESGFCSRREADKLILMELKLKWELKLQRDKRLELMEY